MVFWRFVANAIAAELQRRGHEVELLTLIARTPANHSDDAPTLQELLSGSEILSHLTELNEGHPYTAQVEREHEQLIETMTALIKHLIDIGQEFVSPVCDGTAALLVPTIDEPMPRDQFMAEWAPYLKGTVSVHDIASTHAGMNQPASMAAIGQILDQAL